MPVWRDPHSTLSVSQLAIKCQLLPGVAQKQSMSVVAFEMLVLRFKGFLACHMHRYGGHHVLLCWLPVFFWWQVPGE